MNLSITNKCNRRCKFCFQRDWYLSKTPIEMNLSDIERFLNWLSQDHFKILGGEPLCHSQFYDILELTRKYHKTVTILTNLTLDISPILSNKDVVTNLHINSHYHNIEKNIFLTNIKTLIDNDIFFTISYTLIPDGLINGDIEKALKRFNEIFEVIPLDHPVSIRLGLMSPDVNGLFRLYDYSYDFLTLITKLFCMRKNLEFSLDCAVNACELDPKVIDILRKYKISFRTGQCDHCNPFDILIDFSAMWCYSANQIRLNNIFEYRDSEAAKKALKLEWDRYWLNTENMCDYRNCPKFNPGYCIGYCAGRNEALRLKKYAIQHPIQWKQS